MANIVPYIESRMLVAPTMIPLPAGQSQLVHIVCTEESVESLLGLFREAFGDDRWSHVVIVAHSEEHGVTTGKQGNAWIVLEWEEAYIDAFFLRGLEIEDAVIDFTVFLRDSEV